MPKPKGSPKTGGRKKGSFNKTNNDLRKLLDAQVDYREVVGKLQELADGVHVVQTTPMGDIIYQRPPNESAAKILMEYRFGKAPQAIALTDNNGKPLTLQVLVASAETKKELDKLK